jgi:phenylalanyl-tRNA synthetase alpha chain
MELDLKKIIESLSPIERKILPFINEGNLELISKKVELDETGIMRGLEFLSNKGILKITTIIEKVIELELNGILYLKQGLPERRLLKIFEKETVFSLEQAKQISKLNENEFKAALGVLKKKALINILNSNILLSAKKEEIINKTLEEKFLDSLPKKLDELLPEEKYAFENLKSRKEIIVVKDKKIVEFKLTELGEKVIKQDYSLNKELIESLTPEIIKSGSFNNKKFRRYDILSPVPKICGGKRHFVNQAIDYAKKIWLEMGFKEMTGNIIVSGFWNFDALFTAQDHPVREMHDTFFIKDKTAKLPEKKIVEKVKNAHEGKIKGSKGWQYEWKENDAKKILLRTHTTCLSAQTLKEIAKNKEFPAKYFAIGKCFRNETLDWNHGFEFNQTEGIVIDKNANLKQLLGYLKEFAKKMGYNKVRFRPSYFPYTEPSVEGEVWNEEKKIWMEVFAAGIFRPEVVIPFFGEYIPVLAWGPGFDRLIMKFYEITDLREMYSNDLNKLRTIKFWNK